MSYIHDVVKINYIREGYLPNYPYHMISDEEMVDAFLNDGTCYFKDYYPLVNPNLKTEYNTLIENIQYHLDLLKASQEEYTLPNWIYSYMLGAVISVNSSIYDIHDMLVMMNLDNLDDIFTPEASAYCYEVSTKWLNKIPIDQRDHRPPGMFGEPHVLKSLRLSQVQVES